MLSQKTALWLRQKWMQARRLPKAFVSSAGILNLPITSLPVDNFKDRALWCKPTGINYNMHGWILCRYCATGWFWWISGLRAVTMWSSASFTKIIVTHSLAYFGTIVVKIFDSVLLTTNIADLQRYKWQTNAMKKSFPAKRQHMACVL